MHFRPATLLDAPAIAALHTLSWQQTYRGDFSDHYLDVEAPAERLQVWTERFTASAAAMQVSVVEEEGVLIGFSCVFPWHAAEDGHLLDNLHVHPAYHGRGLGKKLMQYAASRLAATVPTGEMYLWVLTSNEAAIGFYERLGGRPGRKEFHHFAAGNTTEAIMMSWPLAALVGLSTGPEPGL